jgi:alanine dehydrogenase
MMRIGVVRESGPGERRVATVPAVVPRLREPGADVLVEHDARVGAFQLYTNPHTGMYFADAKKGLAALTGAVKTLVG